MLWTPDKAHSFIKKYGALNLSYDWNVWVTFKHLCKSRIYSAEWLTEFKCFRYNSAPDPLEQSTCEEFLISRLYNDGDHLILEVKIQEDRGYSRYYHDVCIFQVQVYTLDSTLMNYLDAALHDVVLQQGAEEERQRMLWRRAIIRKDIEDAL